MHDDTDRNTLKLCSVLVNESRNMALLKSNSSPCRATIGLLENIVVVC